MKRKWILLLCGCVLMTGCARTMEETPPGKHALESTVESSEESGTGSGGSDVGSSGEAGTGSGGSDVESSGEAGTGSGGSDVESSGESGQRTVTGDPGKERETMKIDNSWQRAAYFADRVYEEGNANVLVSPMSLELALGLAAVGAGGETARELYEYLGDTAYGDFAKGYMEFAEGLTRQLSEDREFDFTGYSFEYSIANSVWVAQNRKLQKSYLDGVTEKFHAEVSNVDFAGKPAKTAERINSWCEEKTNGLIPEIVDAKQFSKDLAAILVNTVYFESPWADTWGTVEHSFQNLEGEKTNRTMLSDTVQVYYENEHATAFEKDYLNGFRFIGILPKAQGDFSLTDLDLQSLMESRTEEYDVKAIAPKLDYETSAENIVEMLQDQGVTEAFDPRNADFGGMIELSGDEAVYISDILQKCKIELDEEGTRAAAVTAIMMKLTCAIIEEPRQVKEVFLDRPFAFLIYDSVNDRIVFIGKVTDV